MTGIELDPVTARIARALYPQATIRAESFADTDYSTGSFDGAIGNVPFANVTLHDRRHNPNGHSLHNHFILKAIDLVRPGGLVAVLSSSFTLDAQNPGARREMYAKADLFGALRLPNGTHRRTAGTEAMTDLLLFRRREDGRAPGDDAWIHTSPIRIDGHAPRRVNAYFTGHPERVLGRWHIGPGMYGQDTLGVESDDLHAVPDQVRRALAIITGQAAAADLTVTQRGGDPGRHPQAGPDLDTSLWLGMVLDHPVDGFQIVGRHGTTPLDVSRTQRAELRALLAMRDHARELLQLEAATATDTPEITGLRGTLAGEYDTYRARYGPINRFTAIETKPIDPDTGEPRIQRRKPPVMRYLRTEPFASLVRALEVFDESTHSASPAPLLRQRVVPPRTPVLGVDTPDEAITVALDTDGEITLQRVADLLGTDQQSARAQLGELAFDDPETGRLVSRAEYLSGNVRAKLDVAEAALPRRRDLAANVAALRAVLPEPLGADDVRPRIGAVWIPAQDYQDFIRQLIGDQYAKVEYGGGTIWGVKAATWSVAATSEWGTSRRPAGHVLQSLLENAVITVYDTLPDKTRVLNPIETEAAREKAAAMQERFEQWVWEDPDRARRLLDEYNRLFNCLVLRDYSDAGQHLTLPGKAATFAPRPHQLAAVARMLSEPAVGLFHEVGAGKTAEMVIGAMELKRLGMVSKPVAVVPNHMLDQFSREWLYIYPQANVLAATTDDLTAQNRRDFIARVTTGDWDGIVMTRSAFSRLAVSTEWQISYTERELAGRRAQLERIKQQGGSLTVKRIERQLLAAEEKLKALQDQPRDPGLSFEDTGIDYLIVDEAHGYKNLATMSNIPDANIAGSKQASDLHMKAELLRERHGRRVLTLATATPIANSVTEAHVMTRYLRPDLLQDAGVLEFDQWAATFGKTVTELETAPAGGGRYREKTRFASFQNLPEMLRMWHVFADVKTAEDLHLPTPDIARRPDGVRGPETVVVPPTPELLAYVEQLGRRADALSGRSEPGEDNMLTITTDGRRAALDLRLVGLHEPAGPTKITVAADRIAAIWRAYRDREYLDETDTPSPTRGAFQIVFCDQSTPKPDRWNVYSELKTQLIDRGLAPRSVRFIHDANTDQDKGRLFAACRCGDVAVLIGSTEKMGIGTNVQARAVALHHLDCPWRPADLAQRDGRILRQGNQNPEIAIIRYTTARSFDTYSWQTVERKAKFIGQVLRGRLDMREIQDIGDSVLSLGETKALTADDPLLLEKATADTTLARLERLSRAHQRNLSLLGHRSEQAARVIERANDDEPLIVAAIDRSVATTGGAFHMRIAGRSYSERPDAARALRQALMSAPRSPYDKALTLDASIGGHEIEFARKLPASGQQSEWTGRLAGVPRTEFVLTPDSIAEGIGSVRTIENRIAALRAILGRLRADRDDAEQDQCNARESAARPFKHADALAAARAETRRINAILAERARPAPQATDQPDTADARNVTDAKPRPVVDDIRPCSPASVTDLRPAIGTHGPPAGEQVAIHAELATGHIAERGQVLRVALVADSADRASKDEPAHQLASPAPADRQQPTMSHNGPKAAAHRDDPVAARAGQPTPHATSPGNADPHPTSSDRPGPFIQHGHAGTIVLGTDKSDAQLRDALKAASFRWSSRQRFWYLPRTFHEATRTAKIGQLQQALHLAGRPALQIAADASDAATPPPAQPTEAQPLATPTGSTAAGPAASSEDRWCHYLATVPGLARDPHWAVLAAQLDRLASAGSDVPALIRRAQAGIDPASTHPARDLDYAIAALTYLPADSVRTTELDPPSPHHASPPPRSAHRTRPAPPR